MLESLFNKVAGLQLSCEYFEIFKSSFFHKKAFYRKYLREVCLSKCQVFLMISFHNISMASEKDLVLNNVC